MSVSRAISEWSTTDFGRLVELVRRISEYVAEHEPDTLAFEAFGDPATGKVLLHQAYVDDSAFLVHANNMRDAGFMDDLAELLSPERLVLLSRPSDEGARQMAEQQGALVLEPLAAFTR